MNIGYQRNYHYRYRHFITHQSMLYELLSKFDWFTLIILRLHVTLIYLLCRIQVAHVAWIYLLWWIRLIRRQFVAVSSGRCSSAHFTGSDVAYDGFIKHQFEKFTQTVAETVLKFLLLSYLSSFVYVHLKLQ